MKLSRLFAGFFSVVTLTTTSASAIQEFEAVVEDKRFNSSSTIVIDEAEIKKSRAKDVTTLLATQANISVTQSNFQPNSIFLRGGDSSHVLILVDGVPFYDASTIQRTVNLNTVNLKSIQKIEIIKGSQSVLFGGQALSGVIKITTIPKVLKSSGQVIGQVGTRNSGLLSFAGMYAFDENQAVALRQSVSGRDNKSPVLDSNQKYPTRFSNSEAVYIYKNENLESFFKAQTSFDDTKIVNADQLTFKPVDTENFTFSTYQLATSGSVKLINGMKPQASVAYQRGARLLEIEGTPTKLDFNGELLTARFETHPILSETLSLTAGLSLTQEKLYSENVGIKSADVSADYQGVFVKADYKLNPDILLEAGARNDSEKWLRSIGTYQLGATFFKNYKAEYSTGFKRPSLAQLNAVFANPDLPPERSISTSLSYETNLTKDWFFSMTAFQNEFKNLIVARGFPTRYEALDSMTVGAEATTGLRFEPEQTVVNFSVGYQEPRDTSQANWLPRRPLRTASIRVRKEINALSLGAEVVHSGDRRDRTGSITYDTVPNYTYLNATTEYKFTDSFSMYARGQNITNLIYQSSYSYYDEGQNYVLGAEYTF